MTVIERSEDVRIRGAMSRMIPRKCLIYNDILLKWDSYPVNVIGDHITPPDGAQSWRIPYIFNAQLECSSLLQGFISIETHACITDVKRYTLFLLRFMCADRRKVNGQIDSDPVKLPSFSQYMSLSWIIFFVAIYDQFLKMRALYVRRYVAFDPFLFLTMKGKDTRAFTKIVRPKGQGMDTCIRIVLQTEEIWLQPEIFSPTMSMKRITIICHIIHHYFYVKACRKV